MKLKELLHFIVPKVKKKTMKHYVFWTYEVVIRVSATLLILWFLVEVLGLRIGIGG